MTLPDGFLGDFAMERQCSRRLGRNADGFEHVCGAPPIVHIIWCNTPEGVEQGWACATHRGEFPAMAEHPVGACCGMPGSRYLIEENVCLYPDDELPTAEPVRTIAVPVEAA